MRIVDLSAPIVPSPPGTPESRRTDVAYLSHADGAREIESLLGVGPELLRDGEGWTRETLTLGTHNTTQVDAPWHYNSTIGGRPAETIDQLPLEWFFAPGIDAWGWDRPLHLQAQDALRERRPGIFWEAHQADLRYCQIERLVGLGQLPPSGFPVACFPLRVSRGSAAPARVVAILDDET